jgi:hypothetical protein
MLYAAGPRAAAQQVARIRAVASASTRRRARPSAPLNARRALSSRPRSRASRAEQLRLQAEKVPFVLAFVFEHCTLPELFDWCEALMFGGEEPLVALDVRRRAPPRRASAPARAR